MDRYFRQSNDRFDNLSQATEDGYSAQDAPHAASVNARFLSYLEQFYAPCNPRCLIIATTALFAGIGALTAVLLTFVRPIQMFWPLFVPTLLLLARQILRLHGRLANRHRLLQVRDVIETGIPVTGFLVQAPSSLFRPGMDTLPALVLFSFQPEVSGDAAYMQHLADQLYRAKSATVTPENRFLVAFAAKEPGVTHRRRLLPYSLTDGSTIYCADVWISRKYLRNGYLSGEPLPLLAQSGDSGGIELVPWWLTFPSEPSTSSTQDNGVYA